MYSHHSSLDWGWRFLYGLKQELANNNGILVLGLNPGGETDTRVAHHPDGNVYIDPQWDGEGTRWARQVHHLCRTIHGARGQSNDWKPFMDRLPVSNLVPFRAPEFEAIEPRRAIIEFGRSLWERWLEILGPDIVVALGIGLANPSPYRSLRRIWGNYTIKTTQTNRNELLIGVPHLSRCQFSTSEKGKPARAFVKELVRKHR